MSDADAGNGDAVNDDHDAGRTWSLVDGCAILEMGMEDSEGGFKAAVLDVRVGRGDVIHVTHDSAGPTTRTGFFNSEQKRRTFRKRLLEKTPDGIDAEMLAAEFDRITDQLAAHARDDEVIRQIRRSETTSRLLRETVSVKMFAGEESSFVVTVENDDGRTATLQFTTDEWAFGGGRKAAVRQYLNEMEELVDLSDDDWEVLRDEWDEMREVVHRERQTSSDVLRDSVIAKIRNRLTVYDERDALGTDIYIGFYDDGGTIADSEIPAGETVVWVHSDSVRDALDAEGYDSGSTIGQLSIVLKKADMTLAGSRRKNEGALWPFRPEAVGVDDPILDVHREEDEDTEIEP